MTVRSEVRPVWRRAGRLWKFRARVARKGDVAVDEIDANGYRVGSDFLLTACAAVVAQAATGEHPAVQWAHGRRWNGGTDSGYGIVVDAQVVGDDLLFDAVCAVEPKVGQAVSMGFGFVAEPGWPDRIVYPVHELSLLPRGVEPALRSAAVLDVWELAPDEVAALKAVEVGS